MRKMQARVSVVAAAGRALPLDGDRCGRTRLRAATAATATAAYFRDYGATDKTTVRGFDVCVPTKKTFGGVYLCATSGTGH